LGFKHQRSSHKRGSQLGHHVAAAGKSSVTYGILLQFYSLQREHAPPWPPHGGQREKACRLSSLPPLGQAIRGHNLQMREQKGSSWLLADSARKEAEELQGMKKKEEHARCRPAMRERQYSRSWTRRSDFIPVWEPLEARPNDWFPAVSRVTRISVKAYPCLTSGNEA
jgi:hypothetical protein